MTEWPHVCVWLAVAGRMCVCYVTIVVFLGLFFFFWGGGGNIGQSICINQSLYILILRPSRSHYGMLQISVITEVTRGIYTCV